MKPIIILICAIMVIITFGCANENKIKPIVVAGEVKDSTISVVELRVDDKTLIDTIIDSRFFFRINEAKSRYLHLKIKWPIRLYAGYGDSIFINFQDYPIITGIGAHESIYLEKKNALSYKLGISNPKMIDKNLYSSCIDEFLLMIDSIKHQRISLLDEELMKYPDLNEEFVRVERNVIDFFWMNQKLNYPGFYTTFTNSEPNLGEGYFDFIQNIDMNDTLMFYHDEYRNLLKNVVSHKATKQELTSPQKEIAAKYSVCKSELVEKAIFEKVVFDELMGYMRFNGVSGCDQILKEYLSITLNEDYKKKLKREYAKWEPLKKGNLAPDFKLEDVSGAMISLSDFKGKQVYIDCWSTYCGPCLKEMPALKKLVSEIDRENSVIVTVSVDKDKQKWIKKVKELDIDAVHLFTGGTNHPFTTDYNTKAFPRYILISGDGKILNAVAEKPSKVLL